MGTTLLTKAIYRECDVSELNPWVNQSIQDYIKGEDQVLLCYEFPTRGEVWVGLITNRLVASASVRMMDLLGGWFLGKPSDRSTHMLFLKDITAIEHEKRPYLSHHYVTVLGSDRDLKVSLPFRSRDDLYERVATILWEASQRAKQEPDIVNRLRQLTQLRDDGLITHEEFQRKREEMLKSL